MSDAKKPVPPACPGCEQPAKAHSYPPDLEQDAGSTPVAWWCNPCLRAKVRALRGGEM